ncbi:hypothetical protein [Cellulophaga omnivescoria]|uniref:hypothetical protein n=1 Tax=Cellulophaga omnivescoria TaxID=1888890 RepID=UPI0022F0F967|nr:hypothetical protein [Cellulophaga omnivescoria]WBU88420.1 hypothetical protein PBN93_11110 [Cellulophaga omnivescoria]
MNKKHKSKHWTEKFENIVFKYTPKLFEILGWLTILGVLRYIGFEKNIISASIIYAIGLLLFSQYVNVYIFKEIIGNNKKRKRKGRYYLIGLISGLFSILVIGINNNSFRIKKPAGNNVYN